VEKANQCPLNSSRSINVSPFQDHHLRWDLEKSYSIFIKKEGSRDNYDLAASAKEAWRNSVRCIGRRLWKALEVIDARSVNQSDEIFEALLHHLRKATNDGKIMPVMTVFKEWDSDGPEIRIWNHQLLRYAGYKNSAGVILGDPINVDLTEIAIALGWCPPSEPGSFDLLPLIIQVGENLTFYELPKTDVREIRIRHPKYPFIESMNVQWYAVPIVSDMIFATGATLHSCAPFSGHYLGTEIGARNLADKNRYNLLPEVARNLGLDIENSRSLWKDHALLALNEAVLWSFDNEGIRISDHHSASDDFQRFCEQEKRAGRQVNAEWSWIVPPMSGSATSVFHQDYSLDPIIPNFLLQVPAWETERGKRLLSSQRR